MGILLRIVPDRDNLGYHKLWLEVFYPTTGRVELIGKNNATRDLNSLPPEDFISLPVSDRDLREFRNTLNEHLGDNSGESVKELQNKLNRLKTEIWIYRRNIIMNALESCGEL